MTYDRTNKHKRAMTMTHSRTIRRPRAHADTEMRDDQLFALCVPEYECCSAMMRASGCGATTFDCTTTRTGVDIVVATR